jgi:hypothetical protein
MQHVHTSETGTDVQAITDSSRGSAIYSEGGLSGMETLQPSAHPGRLIASSG